ncbi:MAG TPA: adenylate/guanylate cyclase domain-containing protein, partial [Anaerolineales bacterium]|nr:adenylate/guanylate cyclase domain-containing protein [Anaerolineales bacterium]
MCGTRLALVCPTCGTVNPRVYRFCSECGAPLTAESAPFIAVTPLEQEPLPEPRPSSDIAVLEGERRVATIILADVKGSTDLMEQVGTETWVKLMNRVLQILETEVYRFGGKVDQFRGDGLVAFFGTTTAHEDDPERAVLAALAMQAALQPFAADLEEREGISLALRVGV